MAAVRDVDPRTAVRRPRAGELAASRRRPPTVRVCPSRHSWDRKSRADLHMGSCADGLSGLFFCKNPSNPTNKAIIPASTQADNLISLE